VILTYETLLKQHNMTCGTFQVLYLKHKQH
jgi:hypothetical protein